MSKGFNKTDQKNFNSNFPHRYLTDDSAKSLHEQKILEGLKKCKIILNGKTMALYHFFSQTGYPKL